VDHFITKHQDKIAGTISCFDRVLFKGHLPLGWSDAMERFVARQGLRLKDFGSFVARHSERIKQHAKAMAERTKRPYIYLDGPVRKAARVEAVLRRDPVAEGLICVLAAVEACRSFKLAYGEGKPRIVPARRKCLCLYFYFMDREFGLLHVRIATWFPFTVQVCLNGHDWLARQLDRHGIGYRQVDNAFISIDHPARAQRMADRFAKRNWPRILSAFARRVNPLMNNLLWDMDYYWVTEQAEYATDVMFKSPVSLEGLYEPLLMHATCRFSAEDVMTFLGRKLNGHFTGDIGNHYKKRWPGTRVRHRMKENGMKMYDKHGCVLRIETVINRPYEFKVRRRGIRKGKPVTDWFPMAKGVANLYRYAEVSLAANRRYLDALAVVEDPRTARQQIQSLAKPVRQKGRSYRGFNPACARDIQLFTAVMRGEHLMQGFCNRDIRQHLVAPTRTVQQARRISARISRLLKRLHAHGLIAKVQRSRRWRITQKGHWLMSAILTIHHDNYPQILAKPAA
jgi:predicted transcriptional regulator